MKQVKMPASADRKVKTSGTFNAAILLVYPSGGSPPDWGEEDLKELFTESKFSPKNFIDENSKGKLEVNFQYFGWGELPHDMDYYSETALGVSEGAILLFDDQIDWWEYDSAFLIIYDKEYHKVGATVVSVGYDTNDGKVYLPFVITSGDLYDGYNDTFETTREDGFVTSIVKEHIREMYIKSVCWHIAHELLHNLGLEHFLGWVTSEDSECHSCDKLNDPENSSNCEIKDYEGWSAMGNKYLNLSCQEKSQLGWIDDSEILEVKTNQTLWLNQRNAESGDKYFKIPAGLNSEGTQTYFFVEYITPVGDSNFDFMFDFVESNLNLSELSDTDDNRAIMVAYWPGGQVIGKYDPYTMGTLLAYSKKPGYPYLLALSGSTTVWCDKNRGLSISVLQETGETAEEAQVQLQVNFECPEEPYYVSVSLDTDTSGTETASYSAHPGEMFNVPLILTTKDIIDAGLDCDPIPYDLGVSAPENWQVQLDSWNASLKAGESATFKLSVSVPSDASSGTYDITVKVSEPSGYLNVEKVLQFDVKKKPNYVIVSDDDSSKIQKVARRSKVSFTIYVQDLDTGEIEENFHVERVLKNPKGKEGGDVIERWIEGNRRRYFYKVKQSDPLGVYTLKLTVNVAEHDGVEAWSDEKELYFKVVETKNGKKIAILSK